MPEYKFPPVASRFKSLIHAGQFIRNPFPILDEALERLGPTYLFYMGGVQKAVLTIDPVAIRHVLQKNNRAYEKSAIVTDLLGKYTGRGLLTSTGEYWLRQRRLIQPGFHKRRIESLEGLMKIEADACTARWSVKAQEGVPFDAYEEMNSLTFRIVARTLFSTSLEEHGLVRLSEIISMLQDFIIREVRQPYKRWWFRLNGRIREHLQLAQDARNIIRSVIRTRRQSGDMPDDLLTMLLESRYEDTGLGMDEEQLIDECLILFVAGHETSANALSWMIYLLGRHTDELHRIQKANGDSVGSLIRNVVLEALRLYPPAWVSDRISLEDDEVLDFHLPRGTMWVMYIRGMHRHPEYWQEPDRFFPDRWNDTDLNKEAYMPFGAGPRLCIGEHFAMMEMQLILTEILGHWDIELISKEITEKPLVTLRPLEQVLIRIRKVNLAPAQA
jgi:cytochrome P450